MTTAESIASGFTDAFAWSVVPNPTGITVTTREAPMGGRSGRRTPQRPTYAQAALLNHVGTVGCTLISACGFRTNTITFCVNTGWVTRSAAGVLQLTAAGEVARRLAPK